MKPHLLFCIGLSLSPSLAADADAPARLEALRKTAFGRSSTAVFEATRPPDSKAPTSGDAWVKSLTRAAARGEWKEVAGQIESTFPDPVTRAEAFRFVLGALLDMKLDPQRQQEESRLPIGFRTTPKLNLADVQGLMEICPVRDPDEVLLKAYSALISTAGQNAPEFRGFTEALERGAGPFGGKEPAARLRAARILLNAGQGEAAAAFLPPLEEAEKKGDIPVLSLWTRHFEALYQRTRRPADLEKAWKSATTAFQLAKTPEPNRTEALGKITALLQQVPEPMGQTWLSQTLASQPEIGVEILANAGLQTLKNRTNGTPDARSRNLILQQRVVDALLKAAPDRIGQWKAPLDLMAGSWRAEAEWTLQRDTTSSRGPQMEFDPFGNVYFQNNDETREIRGGEVVQPIPAKDVLKSRPSDGWLAILDPSLLNGYRQMLARLQLKVRDPDAAFPFIQQLAADNPREAAGLASELLDVWAEKNDPNSQQRRTNRYMFIYGYNPATQGIPLTRSRQIRNLEELGEWVRKIRALPLGESFRDRKWVEVLSKCHGMAEVFRLDDIRNVLGDPTEQSSETVAALAGTMRQNLAGKWKDEKVQQTANTGRKETQIRATVLQGYATALAMVSARLEKDPENWKLLLEHAALRSDENIFIAEKEKDSTFTTRREAAFHDFQAAAAAYAKALPELEDKDQSVDVFTTWFYASLGASDLAKVTAEQVPSPGQLPLIREAIQNLSGEAAEKHETRFANALATRASAVQPAVKQRYAEMGLAIAGENERAQPIREVAAFYRDIIKEISLEVKVDVSPDVGTEPFGVWVNLRHTVEVEQASGGFQKYLVNQNSQPMFWNFGRPPENYRDKFTDGIKEALGETFEVLSVTFHSEKVTSQGTDSPGWRITPYAFLYLRSKGPQVDVIPPIKLNLDFMETGGYVILPVTSGRVLIDSSKVPPPPKLERVEITQTLDERKLKVGQLDLEIHATAVGLLPSFNQLLKAEGGGFKLADLVDQGLQITRLETPPEGGYKVLTERNWTAKWQREAGTPQAFRYPQAVKKSYQVIDYQYVGNDLKEVPGEVSFEAAAIRQLPIAAAAGTVALLFGIAGWGIWARQRRQARQLPDEDVPEVPEPLTVLALIRYLERLGKLPSLDETARRELAKTLCEIEAATYAEPGGTSPTDWQRLAETWRSRASIKR